VVEFLLWLILLVIAVPLALLALILYPIVWLISIPFRLVGISVRGILDPITAIITFPAGVVRGPKAIDEPDPPAAVDVDDWCGVHRREPKMGQPALPLGDHCE
jgi:hypothetical protein